jgi:RNA-binding protein
LSKITTRMKRHVKHELKEEKPTIHVGKEGFTTQSAKEIDKQLEQNKMVKVKILKSALQAETAKTIATKAAEQTSASLVEVRGHVFILYRRRKKQQP